MSTGGLFIYAETAFHHEGDRDFLRRLIDAAADAGADGVKFQLLIRADALLARTHPSFARLAACTLSPEAWAEMIGHAADQGLKVVALPLDLTSFEVIRAAGATVAWLDIHSVLFHDSALLSELRKVERPIILGIGGRTIEEIDDKRGFFGSQLQVLMTGFQAFPTQLADVRLQRIAALRARYPELVVGYADHSAPLHDDAVAANEWAFALGARMFEKHLTLADAAPGRLDSEAAVGPQQFADMCRRLRRLDQEILPEHGDRLFEMTTPERTYRDRQRVAVAVRALQAGHRLQAEDIRFCMTGRPGGFATAAGLLGATLARPVASDMPILVEDLAGEPPPLSR